MAKFCVKCGTALDSGARFCPGCGTPVAQITPPPQTPPPQNAPQHSAPPQNAPQPQASPRPAQRAPQYAAPQGAPQYSPAPAVKPKKKGKGWLVALIIILVVAALGAVAFFGFRPGGWFRAPAPSAKLTTLVEYAKSLEEAGNPEAAEAVYELIAKGGGADLIEKAHNDIPAVKAADDIDAFIEVFSKAKGGDGK